MNPERCSVCQMTFSPLMLEDGKCSVCRMPRVSWKSGEEIRRKRFVEMIECACGCGTRFNKYDDRNRPRTFCDKRHQWNHERWRLKRKAMARGIRPE